MVRDRNVEYLESRFGNSDSYCLPTRVWIVNRVSITQAKCSMKTALLCDQRSVNS